MAIELKNYEPALMQGASIADTGETITGALSVSGTSTLTGVATLAAVPVFSAGLNNGVTSVTGATATVTTAQSGTTLVLNRAAGCVLTLPVPVAGLTYDVIVGTSITGGTGEIDTSSGSVFLLGSVLVTKSTDGTVLAAFADGAATVKIAGNGTTTGALKGSWVRLTAISTTVWGIQGFWLASGSIATPFA